MLGGISSARTLDGGAALFAGEQVMPDGAVGVAFRGVDIHAAVSQGAAPIGPEMTITAAEGHMIQELAGRPALTRLRDAVAALPESERDKVAEGLLLGVVVDQGKPEFERGDFLVRALLGADPDTGALAVGAYVEPGPGRAPARARRRERRRATCARCSAASACASGARRRPAR